MFHFFLGTKAQLVKMAPVMLEFQRRGLPWRYVDSGQHARLTAGLRELFGLREPDAVLRPGGEDVASLRQAVGWVAGLGRQWLSGREELRRRIFADAPGTCLIHGDTLSTFFGLLLARRAGLRVAHVEAGLRSHSLLNPFPEELVRIVCMRLADVLLCPSEEAAANLAAMGVRGRVVRLPGNTVLDALRLAEQRGHAMPRSGRRYALATCHRFETITSRRRLTRMLGLLREAAAAVPVVFVQHEPTRRAMERWRLGRLLDGAAVEVLPPQGYFAFIALLRHAEFVLTDGGSIQEECFYLGKPCFLMRRRTERREGLGENAVLGGFDRARLRAFLEDYPRRRRVRDLEASPSAAIADALAADAT